MTRGRRRRAAGVALTLLGLPGVLLRLAWLPGLRWSALVNSLGTVPPDRSLPLLLALGLCCLSCWVALTVAVTLAARLPGQLGRLAAGALHHVAPAAVRRTAEVVLGASALLATTGGLAQATGPAQAPAAAHAVAAAQTTAHSANAQVAGALAGGLDRPASASTPAPPPSFSLDRPADPSRGIALVSAAPTRTVAAQALSTTVVVQPGDSLWRIAARSLPHDADAQAIERAWHRWYAANRQLIGPDPGLLQPGQQLIAPSP